MVNVAEYTMRRSNRGLISKYSHTESSWGSSLSSSTWGIWVIPRVVAPRCRGASDIFQQRADFCTMIIMLTIDNVTCMYNIAKRIDLYINIRIIYIRFTICSYDIGLSPSCTNRMLKKNWLEALHDVVATWCFCSIDASYPRSKQKKRVSFFDHVGGFEPVRIQGMCLHVLLQQNGFCHPSGKLVVAQPLHDSICQSSKLSFCYLSMGQLRCAVSI